MILKNLPYKLFFYFSSITSFFFGLILYDTTTGLDWEKYMYTVGIYLNFSEISFDGQGALYFSIIARFIDIIIELTGENNILYITNYVVHIINFCLYLIGIFGIVNLLKYKFRLKNINYIYLTISITNFFPTLFYTRWTMKPEIFAFCLLPWSIYYLDKYFKYRNRQYLILSVSTVSLLLSQKASITGMVLLCFLVLYNNEVKNIKNNLTLFLAGLTTTCLLFLENKITIGKWIFDRPDPISEVLLTKWNYTANAKFFYFIDFKNLIENPFKHMHSDSLISITLLDTMADYFGFFWNHKEKNNLIAFNKISLSENFLIQTFLPEYLSIIFSLCFYLLILIFIYNRLDNWKMVSFPLMGLIILIINSLGFPSKNFDPTTGDLFKVHYYSFLIGFSFIFILYYLINYSKIFKLTSILLIPFFFLVMGFPKQLDENYLNDIKNKLEFSHNCESKNIAQKICNEEILNNFYEYPEKNKRDTKSNKKFLLLNNFLLCLNLTYYLKNKAYLIFKK